MNTIPCCKKCEIHLDYKTQNEYQCNNRECECHIPSNDWREEFDAQFKDLSEYVPAYWGEPDENGVVEHIRG